MFRCKYAARGDWIANRRDMHVNIYLRLTNPNRLALRNHWIRQMRQISCARIPARPVLSRQFCHETPDSIAYVLTVATSRGGACRERQTFRDSIGDGSD